MRRYAHLLHLIGIEFGGCSNVCQLGIVSLGEYLLTHFEKAVLKKSSLIKGIGTGEVEVLKHQDLWELVVFDLAPCRNISLIKVAVPASEHSTVF